MLCSIKIHNSIAPDASERTLPVYLPCHHLLLSKSKIVRQLAIVMWPILYL